MGDDPEFQRWIETAKAVPLLDALGLINAQLKRKGNEMTGPCPACGGTDRFSVHRVKAVWICRGSKGGHDAIGMVMHCAGVEFVPACKLLTGQDPPRGKVSEDAERAAAERHEARREDADREQAKRNAAEARRVERRKTLAESIWEASGPFERSKAADYLRVDREGLVPTSSQTMNLRCHPALEYWGFHDKQHEEDHDQGRRGKEILGQFPAMVGAMRDLDGNLTGVHLTYLDPERPRKLTLEGPNPAKKVEGVAMGSLLWLSPALPCTAFAEGIETALAWLDLGRLGDRDVGLAVAYSLGNLCGGATGSVPHPWTDGRTIANGRPNPENRGMLLPREVTQPILLGDGDSEVAMTKALLLTQARRLKAEGRDPVIDMAPKGLDWDKARRQWLREGGRS